ncbi:MAG: lipopolysaccharide heptosyltransferase II [Nitrospirota bacterium]
MMREKILVRVTNWVGDLVMATPALAGIRKSYPEAEITALVRPPLDSLLLGNPAIDHVMPLDRKGRHSGPAGLARMVGEIRGKKFKSAILLQNAFEAALLAFLSNIPERMGYATDGRGILLTKGVRVSDETRTKHQVYYYLDLIEKLGLKTDGHTPKLYLTRDEISSAWETLDTFGIRKGDIIIGINPGAQYGIAKKWHPERFGQVADKLAKKAGAKTIIFGGPGEANTANAVQASMRESAVNLAGKTGLRELMALIKACSLFITNDSGPMHVAAALDVPALAIFGSTDPAATGPFNKKSVVVREPVTCSPCFKRTCPYQHYNCLERVSTAKVLKAAEEMLSQNA